MFDLSQKMERVKDLHKTIACKIEKSSSKPYLQKKQHLQAILGSFSDLPQSLNQRNLNNEEFEAEFQILNKQKIFNKICPGKEFLGLSDELDAKIKERATERGYVDDERLMLESALDMISSSSAAPTNDPTCSDDEVKQDTPWLEEAESESET